MDPLSGALVGGIVIGLGIGYPIWTWWADFRRGKFDAKRAFNGRSAYRSK